MSGMADHGAAILTGRITAGPCELLRSEVLEPQFRFEVANLLTGYLRIERVLLLEYHRMDLLTRDEVEAIDRALSAVDRCGIAESAATSMADIAFAIERAATAALATVPVAWHVDRSRNDLQATAQLMYGRERVIAMVEELLAVTRAAHRIAERESTVLMPGYTHAQPAQVMTAGFYFTALAEQLLHTLRRFETVFCAFDSCPMGAGAMTGGDLPWDTDRMAALLGFSTGAGHALRSVAARDWSLEAMAELCLLGVPLSRFVTDLMTWGSAGHGFIDLPDEWSGISSAMPQKKNFPVLERLRARTAHLASGFLDVVIAQRGTPFSNTIEVSKESTSGVPAAFEAASSVLRLLSAVLDNLSLRADRLRAACEAEYLGGFRLANALCLTAGVPWRTAQIVAGRYVVAATERGLAPSTPDGGLLESLAGDAGFSVHDGESLLVDAFDVDRAVTAKQTLGSTGPEHVRAMLDAQAGLLGKAECAWAARRVRIAQGYAEADRLLAAVVAPGQRGEDLDDGTDLP